MWKQPIPILHPHVMAANGWQKAVDLAVHTRQQSAKFWAGVVVEDGEVTKLVIAHRRDQAKCDGLA